MLDSGVPVSNPLFGTSVTAADLLGSRRLAQGLVLCGTAQAALTFAGLPGWPCPLHEGLGLPCPGCGLSRATASLLRGDWPGALAIHPFAPLVLVVLAMLLVAALAPRPVVLRLSNALRLVDARTRLTFIVVTAFLVHGVVRLVVSLPMVGGMP